jgi:hypothetical protein
MRRRIDRERARALREEAPAQANRRHESVRVLVHRHVTAPVPARVLALGRVPLARRSHARGRAPNTAREQALNTGDPHLQLEPGKRERGVRLRSSTDRALARLGARAGGAGEQTRERGGIGALGIRAGREIAGDRARVDAVEQDAFGREMASVDLRAKQLCLCCELVRLGRADRRCKGRGQKGDASAHPEPIGQLRAEARGHGSRRR